MNEPTTMGGLAELLQFLQDLAELKAICYGHPTAHTVTALHFRITKVYATGQFLLELLDPENAYAAAGTLLVSVAHLGAFGVLAELTEEVALHNTMPALRAHLEASYHQPIKE